MREIKFRAWVKDEERMFNVGSDKNERNYFLRNNGKLFRIVKLSDKKGQNFLLCETEAIIMQFTGLLDKLGKEIFELMEINNKYKVEYKTPEYVLTNISNGDILSFKEVSKNENGLTITKEYTEI